MTGQPLSRASTFLRPALGCMIHITKRTTSFKMLKEKLDLKETHSMISLLLKFKSQRSDTVHVDLCSIFRYKSSQRSDTVHADLCSMWCLGWL